MNREALARLRRILDVAKKDHSSVEPVIILTPAHLELLLKATVEPYADLLPAAKKVMDGLHARIEAANGVDVPVFYGIAELSSAIVRASQIDVEDVTDSGPATGR